MPYIPDRIILGPPSVIRTDIINSIASRVDSYKLRAKGFEYDTIRQRQIFESLTQGVQYVFNNAVEGDIVEFGTASGFSGFTIARAMSVYRQLYGGYLQTHGVPQKLLYLLDSFEGLPQSESPVDQQSPNVSSGRWKQGTFKALSKEELGALCGMTYDADKIRIIEGWYSSSLQKIPAATKFAMMHVDCDLYSSSIEVLDYAFTHNHVSDGAVIFFDDWNCNRSSPRFGQRRAWAETVQKHKLEFSDGGDYAALGHKFTVHMG